MDDKKTITITIEEYNLLLENQKQVDELKEERYYTEQDTAKEIFTGIKESFVFSFIGASKDYEKGYCDALTDYDKQLKDFAKERYGVEVE